MSYVGELGLCSLNKGRDVKSCRAGIFFKKAKDNTSKFGSRK